MNRKQIQENLLNILKTKFCIASAKLSEDMFDLPLTGEFNFDALSLMYLYLEVCSVFKVKIEGEKLLDYEFNSINKITSMLEEQFMN